MENASKALIMAGGVLIGVLIISLAVYLFVSFGQTSAEINSQNAQKQISQFNSQFTSYEGNNQLTIHDVVTVANFAMENNKYYDNNPDYIVEVYLKNTKYSTYEECKLLKKRIKDQVSYSGDIHNYSCEILSYHSNGRVLKIKFLQIDE